MPRFAFLNTVRRVLQQSIRVYIIPINRTITYKTVSRKPNEYKQLHYRSPTKNNLIMEYNVYLAMDLSTVFITFTIKGLSPFWVRTVRYPILDREGAKMTMEMIFLSNISKSTYMYLKSIKNIYYLQKQSIKYTKSSSLDFTTYKCSGEIRACFFVVSCFVERKRPLSLCKSRITFLCCSANKGF